MPQMQVVECASHQDHVVLLKLLDLFLTGHWLNMCSDEGSLAEKLHVAEHQFEVVLEEEKNRNDEGDLVQLLHALQLTHAELFVVTEIDR